MTAKYRPLSFNAPMIKAIMDGRKTQSRLPVKVRDFEESPPYTNEFCLEHAVQFTLRKNVWGAKSAFDGGKSGISQEIKAPFSVGDLLWVREEWAIVNASGSVAKPGDSPRTLLHRFGCYCGPMPWQEPKSMGIESSRLTLKITGVRIERIQDITEADAANEGVEHSTDGDGNTYWKNYSTPSEVFHDAGLDPKKWGPELGAKASFRTLWDSIYAGEGGMAWKGNPWVWVIEFEVIHKNILEVTS